MEKADLLFLIAHPDDELLFTGGAIPTYAVEKGKQVAVAYLTPSNTTRRSEALNGLWAMGVRNYPIFGEFSDRYEVSVIDGGPGFNADKVSDCGQRVGTGIQNVRNRLRLTCGGDLKIVSQPGKGTTATIILPKGGEKC